MHKITIQIRVQSKKKSSQRTFNIYGCHRPTASTPPHSVYWLLFPTRMTRQGHGGQRGQGHLAEGQSRASGAPRPPAEGAPGQDDARAASPVTGSPSRGRGGREKLQTFGPTPLSTGKAAGRRVCPRDPTLLPGRPWALCGPQPPARPEAGVREAHSVTEESRAGEAPG